MTSRKLILSAALLLLGGCGGEDNSSQTSNNIMAPLAGDAFEVLSKDDEQTTVSLKGAAIDPQGLPLTLESVVPTNQECDAPTSIDAQALTFTVDNAEPELCFYRYSVKNHPAQASQSKVSEANSYVLKSASAGSLLPPLSETTQVDKPIPINIAPITDYTLDGDVVVLGDGSTVVDSVASTITYTPNAQGVTRLVYTMTSDDGTEMVTGTVDVAVSDVGNTAPDVAPIELLTQPGSGDYFNINESYPIDLSGDVSDADGDDVQLIQVEAWNANVALAAPDDPTNLSFTFQTSSPGAHYVTYVVSDHRGGYGVEQIRIEAYDLSSVATWSDIQKGAKLFSAPLTQSEALISEVPFTSSHVDSNGSTVATFNFDQAQALCASKGHLPTSANLTELVSFEGGPAAKGWPVDIAFWADDGGTPALINLASGAPETESASGHYVACLNEGGFTIDAATSDFEAVANGAEKATVAVKLTFDGAPVVGQLVEASTSNTNVTFDAASGTTDSNGLTSFAMSSFVAEEVPIDITYSGEALTQNVTFIADEDTATVDLITTKDKASYEDVGGNEIEASVVDANSNPLIGLEVTFDSPSSSVDITPITTNTDVSGKQKAKVVWNDAPLGSDTTVDITARFTPLGLPEVSDTTTMTFKFTPPICGAGVNDDDKANAAGNCLKVATDAAGNWFTNTPSVTVMNTLGFSVDPSSSNSGDTYASTYTEDGAWGPNGGEFTRFTQDGSGNGQFARWCEKLASLNFGGQATWRRPTEEELLRFYNKYSSNPTGLWGARGWSTINGYWSSIPYGAKYRSINLNSGSTSDYDKNIAVNGSCIAPVPPLPICGTGVNDTDKTNATGYCLKVATDAAGNWFTSTPSIAVMDKLRYTRDSSSSNSGDTYADTDTEDGSQGPNGGTFAMFNQSGAGVSAPTAGGDGANGQFDRWCQKLNALEFGGKTNWRRPTSSELTAFYQKYEGEGATTGLWGARGWPGGYYWGSDISTDSNYKVVRLSDGVVAGSYWNSSIYASCVSP